MGFKFCSCCCRRKKRGDIGDDTYGATGTSTNDGGKTNPGKSSAESFEIPSIFQPIRVDSPALLARIPGNVNDKDKHSKYITQTVPLKNEEFFNGKKPTLATASEFDEVSLASSRSLSMYRYDGEFCDLEAAKPLLSSELELECDLDQDFFTDLNRNRRISAASSGLSLELQVEVDKIEEKNPQVPQPTSADIEPYSSSDEENTQTWTLENVVTQNLHFADDSDCSYSLQMRKFNGGRKKVGKNPSVSESDSEFCEMMRARGWRAPTEPPKLLYYSPSQSVYWSSTPCSSNYSTPSPSPSRGLGSFKSKLKSNSKPRACTATTTHTSTSKSNNDSQIRTRESKASSLLPTSQIAQNINNLERLKTRGGNFDSSQESLTQIENLRSRSQTPVISPVDEKNEIETEGKAVDLASCQNIQDAFVIAVEQQARERLEKLSALKKIKPVDMTKLLSEAPSGSGSTQELNGLIEAATGSPIYQVYPELSTAAALYGGSVPGEEDQIVVGGLSPLKTSSRSSPSPRIPLDKSANFVQISPQNRNKSPQPLLTNGHSIKVGQPSVPNGQNYVSPSRIDIGSNALIRDSTNKKVEDLDESTSTSTGEVIRNRRSGQSQTSSRESVLEGQNNYANMINMVEYNDGPHREMAVDVPDSFVPRNKTPPRYPPTNKSSSLSNKSANNNKSSSIKSSATSAPAVPTNGSAGKPVPPPRISGGDKEEWNINNNITPQVPPRTVQPAQTSPSKDQAERIRKYQEELKKRRELEEKQAKEEKFLRTSLRDSKKLQALESSTPDPTGFVNDAYDEDDSVLNREKDIYPPKKLEISELIASLERVQQILRKNGVHMEDTVMAVESLMTTADFHQALQVHQQVQDQWCFNPPAPPVSAHLHQIVLECLGNLYNCSVPESAELVDILSRVDLEGVIYAHDKIAERERLLISSESTHNLGESVDDPLGVTQLTQSTQSANLSSTTANAPSTAGKTARPTPAAVFVQPEPDDHIKVVRIDKTQDPLGATVRNEGEAVVVGRIVRGGAADRSGLVHEGDEILEVNGIEMRGKSVNEVCDILSRMSGTLTFLIVPSTSPPMSQRRDVLVHVRAHFDYDPEDDIYLPCRELGIAFSKGDVLHVISQDDANWWQAHREGEEDQALAGLIPSKTFQEQREAVKQTLLGETETREKSKRGTLLCAKTHKKKKKKIPYTTNFNDDFDSEEIPTYEEVALYYPRSSFKRPVVLIGPPNIGRHELRQRLMQESERFAAAVPHTSRPRKDGENHGQDYHFISRAQFEADILNRKFVEHGEFEKAYYGTSLDAIRSVVNIGKICVLNLHPQSLKILRNSDLKPYIVFVAPPPLERLKQMRISRGEAYKEDELIEIIEKAREMEEHFGHYFDLVIINNDIERTYNELVQRINYILREPQWVPSFWLKQ